MTLFSRKELRQSLLQKRASCCSQEWLPGLTENLREYLNGTNPCCLGAYWPIRGEPDLRSFLRCWQTEHPDSTLALPLIVNATMHFALWNPSEPLRKGAYGIPEPDPSHVTEPDVLLIPCVAFDTRRYRLGYGGGWFDRYLASRENRRPLTLGIAYEFSRLRDFSAEPHDIALDAIITEKSVYR